MNENGKSKDQELSSTEGLPPWVLRRFNRLKQELHAFGTIMNVELKSEEWLSANNANDANLRKE